jgi:hypothetical protein
VLSPLEHDPKNIRVLATTEAKGLRFRSAQSHGADRPSRLPLGAPTLLMATVSPDPVSILVALGLRRAAPRAVVKAIFIAADRVGPLDTVAVERALSAFGLVRLLKPESTVSTLAQGIAALARSAGWAQVVELCQE